VTAEVTDEPVPVPIDLDVDFNRAVWREASEIIVDSTWSARSLQKAAARWASIILVLGLPANVIATVTAAGAGAAAIFVRNATVTAVLALVAAVIAGTKAVLKPEDTYQSYASKGSAYLALRNDTRHFRSVRIRTPGVTASELEQEVKALTTRLNALAHQPPLRIPTWAYTQAKRSIEAGESDYTGDRFWEEPPF
jgi:hypothetical protein